MRILTKSKPNNAFINGKRGPVLLPLLLVAGLCYWIRHFLSVAHNMTIAGRLFSDMTWLACGLPIRFFSLPLIFPVVFQIPRAPADLSLLLCLTRHIISFGTITTMRLCNFSAHFH